MKNETDITVILDKSGSMESIASASIGGCNKFLTEQQRQSGEFRLTRIKFDQRHEVVYAGRPIAEVPRVTTEKFEPRGGTDLLDAIGWTMYSTGERLAALPETDRPDRVLIVIVTDGLENSSSDYSL